LIETLSKQLSKDYGPGYSAQSLFYIKQFYLAYPELLPQAAILHAARGKLEGTELSQILHAARGESSPDSVSRGLAIPHALRTDSRAAGPSSSAPRRKAEIAPSLATKIQHAARGETWQPGQLNPNLSWTHYRTLLRVESVEARAFYEIEAFQNNWSARELDRQINSLLYERLALSRDKKGLMRLATKGQEIARPIDVFKDPVVIEFLGLPESPRLVESELEEALIDNLQAFLLEMGKGFAFLARQERITLDGDHFYIDLVFYHTVLKCFVLIDLNVGKLTHGDLGQLQLYVNYYDRERRTTGDNPTLGLILCTDKNDAVVKYTLGPEQSQKIFASRYKLHLPSEAELQAEIRREVRQLTAGEPTHTSPTRKRGKSAKPSPAHRTSVAKRRKKR
jgi:predicted nuclease of restriction endonuclease-like (RecB) superfamily